MLDFHTHNPHATDALISVEPQEFAPTPGHHYSVGIHPWHTAEVTSDTIDRLDQAAAHPAVLAIGETGLDRLRGADLDRQTAILRHHIDLSERLHKPLVLHIVRAYPEIITLKRQLRPTQPWVIHGFRGKPALARQLLDAGFYLSLGERFNPDTAPIIPADRLLIETDESLTPITTLATLHPQLDHTLPQTLLTPSSPQKIKAKDSPNYRCVLEGPNAK